MNKLSAQYIKKVKLLFPILGKPERKYIADLKVNIQDFIESAVITSIEELYQEFGTPQDVVNQYYTTINAEQIIRRVQITKYIRFFLFALMLSLLISTLVYYSLLYAEHKAFMEDSFITSEEIIIE